MKLPFQKWDADNFIMHTIMLEDWHIGTITVNEDNIVLEIRDFSEPDFTIFNPLVVVKCEANLESISKVYFNRSKE